MKKTSIFKKIFSSNQDCCSVDIEEIAESKDQVADNAATLKSDAPCCTPKAE